MWRGWGRGRGGVASQRHGPALRGDTCWASDLKDGGQSVRLLPAGGRTFSEAELYLLAKPGVCEYGRGERQRGGRRTGSREESCLKAGAIGLPCPPPNTPGIPVNLSSPWLLERAVPNISFWKTSNTEMKEQYNKDLYALHLDGKMMTILSWVFICILFIFTKPYETRVQTLCYSILQYFGTQLLRSRTNWISNNITSKENSNPIISNTYFILKYPQWFLKRCLQLFLVEVGWKGRGMKTWSRFTSQRSF